MPEADQVIRMAQAELAGKKAAVDSMMGAEKDERPVFTFQIKLVVPNRQRVETAKALLNGQPKKMGTSDQPQQDAWIWGPVEKHLCSRPPRVVKPTWYWELGQGDHIINKPQRGDDSRLMTLIDRNMQCFKQCLPAGMRGTDLPTWATRMAAGLREGKPLDIRFPNNATDTTSHEQWKCTVLDEEGEFTRGQYRSLVYGDFDPYARRVFLFSFHVANPDGNARFRAAVDGSIEV